MASLIFKTCSISIKSDPKGGGYWFKAKSFESLNIRTLKTQRPKIARSYNAKLQNGKHQNIYYEHQIFKTPKYLKSLKSQTPKYLTSTPVKKSGKYSPLGLDVPKLW